MPGGMTIQGYEGPGAQVFSEEEVNRRRAASGRTPLFPTAPERAPIDPRHDEDDPRRALCSNAELLDALDVPADADTILDRYQARPQRPDDATDHADPGAGKRDVDEILEALTRRRDDARATRADAALPRGTADLAPTILPRRHRATSVGSHRKSPSRRKAATVVTGLLIIMGVCAWATLTIAGAHHSAARPDHASGVPTALAGAGDTQTYAAVEERLAAARTRSGSVALTRPRRRARGATARPRHRPTHRPHRPHQRTHPITSHPSQAASVTAHTSQGAGDSTPTVTAPETATSAQSPAQSTAAPSTSRPASSRAPAFGQNGTLGPGHSPDS
jgi:hypothetical protein